MVSVATVGMVLVVVAVAVLLQCCLMIPFAPPPLLSYWPVPDASAGLRSNETVLIRSASVAGRRHAASPPPIAGDASCPGPIGRGAAAAGHTHPPPPPGSEETHLWLARFRLDICPTVSGCWIHPKIAHCDWMTPRTETVPPFTWSYKNIPEYFNW